MGVSESLTDKQWELLEALVSGHESNGGAEFYFACNFGGCGITFPGGKAVPGVYDETDLLQLRSERLVTLVRPSRNLHRGKPTQLGISTANAGPSRNGGVRLFMNRIPNVDRYPPDFSDAERDAIKVAELRAARVVGRKLRTVVAKAEEETLLVREWVLPIFGAFSKLALRRAKEGVWSLHKTDTESVEFLEALAASAGMNSPDAWMAGGGFVIRAEIWSALEHSEEWNQHRDRLLELIDVADREAISETQQSNPREEMERTSSTPISPPEAPAPRFWTDRQPEFSKYTTRFGGLSAFWRVAFGKWVLWWGSTPGGHAIPQECLDVLNAIARKASTELPSPARTGDTEPWQVWLTFMREQKWGGFRYDGSPIACTEREWDLGVRDGKPRPRSVPNRNTLPSTSGRKSTNEHQTESSAG